MPRLIDWGARYEFIREAVVRLAARGGAGAVTLAAVAAELEVSTATLRRAVNPPSGLADMGARWIARQRYQRRFLRGRPPGVEHGSVHHAAWLLGCELPLHPEELEQERAWTQLVHPGAEDSTRTLQRDEDARIDEIVTGVLTLLRTDESRREGDAVLLRAVLDGLKVALCHERLAPDRAVTCLETLLSELAPDTVSPSAA